MAIDNIEQHESLIQALMDPLRWPQGGANRRRIDTHISTVVLAGDHAYKIKKPLDLGFLDFLSLDARDDACLEELRLNRRLAPAIYQAVCAVTGTLDRPMIEESGEAIDWAVRMRRFDPDAVLSNLVDRLQPELIVELAERVARFHGQIERCNPAERYGSAEAAYGPMSDNLQQIDELMPDNTVELADLLSWTSKHRRRLGNLLEQRKREGWIRECHGDLHLGNVALIDGRPVVFDAIEFNPELRWIDTMNDVAFMTMDLQQRDRSDLAFCFIDSYLQHSGDYQGLRLLRFYEVYRALVRAKIAAIRWQQPDLDASARDGVMKELSAYVDLARRLAQSSVPGIVITQGASASGKSTATAAVLQQLPAVRLRSDIERKRLLGVEPTADATAKGAYSAALTEQTYERLETLAVEVTAGGYVALVDATFLKAAERDRFRQLADSLSIPFAIIDCDAPASVLRDRILARSARADNVSDADLGVLEAQLLAREPLSKDEAAKTVRVRPDQPLSIERLRALLGARIA